MSAADTEPEPQATPETSFDDRALGGAPNPLENIDHLFHHTARRIWLGILGVAILLIAGVLWTTVASQATNVQAQSVIVPRAGLFTAGAIRIGVVTSVLVADNQVVARGQPLAEVQYTGKTHIGAVSPIAGRVITVDVRVGDGVQFGVPMFLIAPVNAAPMAVSLYPAARISQVAVGQKAEVAVNGVAPSRYGLALGRVVAISDIPVSDTRLQELTGNASLLALVSQLGPLREVDIALQRARTPSGLAWTEGKGPPAPLPIGVRAAATITTGRETLIHKAFG
jgi:hypothetical protein